MNRQEKQITVAQVQKDLQASSAFFVVGVKSLTVREMLTLRTALRAENARMQVVKNTLSLQALSAVGNARGMEDVLRNQVALIFAQADPAGVAREICNYAKKCERFTIVAGSLGSRMMNEDMVRFLGTLPPRDVVIAQVCGALKAPIAMHVGLLRQLMVRFLLVLQRIKAEESV